MDARRAGLWGLCLWSLAAAAARAYPESHGPFEKGEEPKRFPVRKCAVLERQEPEEEGALPTRVFGIKDDPAAPRVRVEPIKSRFSGACRLTVLDAKGERRAGPFVLETGYGVSRVLHADLNADKREDFAAVAGSSGCGLAAGRYRLVFILSDSAGYRITTVESMCVRAEDFIDLGDGRARFVQTSFVSGTDEVARDGKRHNYWVHSLLAFELARVVVDNEADARFPKWIWYTNEPNHKATSLLTGEQKRRLWARRIRIFPLPGLPGLRAALAANAAAPRAGPALSPCGRWEARTDVVEKGKTFGVFVRRNDRADSHLVLECPRVLDAFWTDAKERPLLVINHRRVSNQFTVHVHDPETGKTWRPDEKAVETFDRLAPTGDGFDHLFSEAVACSPDRSKLLLHVFGHVTGVMEASRYYVVETDTGAILATYEKLEDVREEWAPIPERVAVDFVLDCVRCGNADEVAQIVFGYGGERSLDLEPGDWDHFRRFTDFETAKLGDGTTCYVFEAPGGSGSYAAVYLYFFVKKEGRLSLLFDSRGFSAELAEKEPKVNGRYLIRQIWRSDLGMKDVDGAYSTQIWFWDGRAYVEAYTSTTISHAADKSRLGTTIRWNGKNRAAFLDAAPGSLVPKE